MENKLEFQATSLGNPPNKKLVLIRETHPLPKDRKDIVSRVGELLSLGKVQKLTIAVGQPIQMGRFVDEDQAGPQPEALPADDLWLEIRNSTLLEYLNPPGETLTGVETLYRAWQMVTEQECIVDTIFIPPSLNLRSWILLPITKNEFFGAKIVAHKEMPDDAVLLAGVNEFKAMGVRVPVDLIKKKKKGK